MVLTKWSNQRATDYEMNGNTNKCLRNEIINALNLRAIGHSVAGDAVTEENFKYDISRSSADTGNTTMIVDNNFKLVFTGLVYDTFPDTSVDTTLWGGSGGSQSQTQRTNSDPSYNDGHIYRTVTDDATDLIINTDVAVTGLNMKQSGNTECMFYIQTETNNGSGSNWSVTYSLKISDGSNKVTIHQVVFNGSGGPNGTNGYFYRLVFNYSGNTVDVYVNGVLTSSATSLSTVTGHWHLEALIDDTAGGATAQKTLRFYTIYYTDGSTSIPSKQFQSSATTASSSSNSGIVYYAGAEGTYTPSIACDGSTFTNATNGEIVSGLTSGTSIKTKFVTTAGSSTVLPKFRSYGMFYG